MSQIRTVTIEPHLIAVPSGKFPSCVNVGYQNSQATYVNLSWLTLTDTDMASNGDIISGCNITLNGNQVYKFDLIKWFSTAHFVTLEADIDDGRYGHVVAARFSGKQ